MLAIRLRLPASVADELAMHYRSSLDVAIPMSAGGCIRKVMELPHCQHKTIGYAECRVKENTMTGQAHYHPKGKMPSQYTIESQQKQRQLLPFEDVQDFEESKQGFIAAPAYRKIMNDKGGVAWSMDNWDFLLEGHDYDSIHPSLQRQSILNMAYGLYEVKPGIYQVRGFDLANMTIIRGKTGWILIDVLTVPETARAALKFVNDT
ncbi:MAG: hypothetical protein MUC89_01940, partial [Acetobacteraceae bacterium]|nr:hypothetical protein [Acetobacteraceae bacterium]